MRTLRFAAALLPLLLAACGGPSATPFQEAAPSYGALAMDVTSTATTGGMGSGPAYAVAAEPAPIEAMAMTVTDCHPHLFLRTADIAMRVNHHLWKFLRHVEVLSTRHPDKVTSDDATWQRTHGNIEVRWTITKVSAGVFTWLLQARSTAHPDWLTIFSGQIDRTGASGPHQGKGTATLDLTALKTVDPMEPSSGLIDASFEAFPDHRKLVVDAKNVVWEGNAMSPFLGASANAHYVYLREPGKGGSFKAHDQMVFVCPVVNYTPPALPSQADVKLLSRWFVSGAPSPAYNGRSDAVMTGGQLDASSRVVGLTCQTASFDSTPSAEAYWLMKEEAATSPFATVPGQTWGPLGNASACDTTFGPVPTIADGANDFDFASLDFDSADPAPFPGGP